MQVNGYPGAEYKGFALLKDAESYINEDKPNIKTDSGTDNTEAIAYVDGSYNESQKRFGYGVVILWNGCETKLKGSSKDILFSGMKNVAGEIMAAEKAIEFCLDNNIKSVTIVHDYEGIKKWCTGEWKTKKYGTAAYVRCYQYASQKICIKFKKVKGHSGDKYNDIADKLAKEGCNI